MSVPPPGPNLIGKHHYPAQQESETSNLRPKEFSAVHVCHVCPLLNMISERKQPIEGPAREAAVHKPV